MWGIPDPVGMPIKEKFRPATGASGELRLSGLPCPRDQAKLWRLLGGPRHRRRPHGGFMMDPEGERLGHGLPPPQARYFSVGQAEPVR